MKIQKYTDDGYILVELDQVVVDLDPTKLLELLYTKKIISAEEVNRILPAEFEVVKERPKGEPWTLKKS